jgi:signal transduction histidine kinase
MAADPPSTRTRSARLTLVSLLLIPLLSLAALWGFTASITLGNVIRDQHYNTIVSAISPSITGLEQTLQVERAVTLVWIGGDRQSSLVQAELTAARGGVDKYAPAVRTSEISVRGLISPTARTALDKFLAALATLPKIRAAVDSGSDSMVAAFNAYNAIDMAEWAYFHVTSPPSDPDLSLTTQAAVAEARAQAAAGGAAALIEGALAAGGTMTQPQRALFAEVIGQQNLEIGDAFTLANPKLTVLFTKILDSAAFRQLQATESQVEDTPADRPISVDSLSFQAAMQSIQAGSQAYGDQVGTVLAAQSAHLSDSLLTQLYVAGGLGLAAVVASVFVMVRFGRRLRIELTTLYDSARQMANERLPRLVDRLRRGEDVDVDAESPQLRIGRITEIAKVAQAFSTVQRTAVEAAVGQAGLRKGVNQVFVNLSLRNQSLLHRQLGMLDGMERATSDPGVLADLFRLDHLTTRMRRHAEGLLILAGATPGRGWRDPVPLVDVLQAAIAEVEDYVRVELVSDTTDALIGTAVNDVIHLIAELVENATAFSPPNTRVEISGTPVGHGFAVEIEDRGLGLAPETLAAINDRLASPPEFDLGDSDQLGLFVAGQLAARHQIRVSLRPSPFGGTTAIVVLPRAIIVAEQDAASWFGTGPATEPVAAISPGPGHEPGTRERGPAFGMTGRHRLASANPAPLALLPPPTSEASGSPSASDVSGTFGASVVSGPYAEEPGGSDGTYLGLPRRVRQANLAPQLRGQPGTGTAAPQRSPEQAGSRLAALQDGWVRGRLEDLDRNGWPDEAGGAAGPNDREDES